MPESLRGVYYDPKHGACVRTITPVQKNLWVISGVYGDDEAGAPGTPWHAHVRLCDDKFLTVDFYGKRTSHERIYRALWCPAVREIHWEDGNVWKKLYSSYDAQPSAT